LFGGSDLVFAGRCIFCRWKSLLGCFYPRPPSTSFPPPSFFGNFLPDRTLGSLTFVLGFFLFCSSDDFPRCIWGLFFAPLTSRFFCRLPRHFNRIPVLVGLMGFAFFSAAFTHHPYCGFSKSADSRFCSSSPTHQTPHHWKPSRGSTGVCKCTPFLDFFPFLPQSAPPVANFLPLLGRPFLLPFGVVGETGSSNFFVLPATPFFDCFSTPKAD